MSLQRPRLWVLLVILCSPMGVTARGDLNCCKIPVSSKEAAGVRWGRLDLVSVGDAMVLSRALSIHPLLSSPGACSALSLRFMQYGHSNKTVLNVTLSPGSPWLRLSPNKEQKESCHVNILADSNLLLLSFFPRLCVKSASSSLHCQMKLLYNTSRSMCKPLLFTGRA